MLPPNNIQEVKSPKPLCKIKKAHLSNWITSNGAWKPNYIHTEQFGIKTRMNKQNMLILEKYSKLWNTLIIMLQNMSTTCYFNNTTTLPCVMIKSFYLQIIHNSPRRFKVARKWIHQFLNPKMNRTFKMTTTISKQCSYFSSIFMFDENLSCTYMCFIHVFKHMTSMCKMYKVIKNKFSITKS